MMKIFGICQRLAVYIHTRLLIIEHPLLLLLLFITFFEQELLIF